MTFPQFHIHFHCQEDGGSPRKKKKKNTDPNKVLLVLGWMTGAHCEDCGDIL